MNKKSVCLLFCIICILSFLSCKKEENYIEEKNIKSENSITNKYTQKYLDFYDQKDNALILMAFDEKEFLNEEIWNNVPFIDPQKTSDQDLGKLDGYYWIIACDDIDFSLGNHRNEVKGEYIFSELEKLSLKRGESFIKAQYDNPNDLMNVVYANSKNITDRKLRLDLGNFFPSDNHSVLIWQNNENIKENSAFISLEKSNKSLPKYKLKGSEIENFEIEENFITAEGKIDLDGDGKEDRISFDGDSPFGYLREISISHILKQSGNLKINDDNFPLSSLSPYDITIDRPNRILDMYIIDIDPKDKFKEILLEIEDVTSHNYKYLVFHYEDNDLYEIGEIEVTLPEYLKNSVNQKNSSLDTKYLTTIGYMEYEKAVSYKLKDDIFVMEEIGESEFNSYDIRLTTVANKAINIYKKPDSDEILFVAKEGQRFIFLKTDNHSWIEVKEFESGEKGYLRFTENDEGFSFYQQAELGESFEDVFWPVPIPDPIMY